MLDPEEFVDFQSTRPSVRMVEGHTRKIEWPEFEFYEARIPRAPRDLILLSGPEPAMRWRTFCEKVIAASTDQLEEYRVFMVLHLTKCKQAPATMTYAAAVEFTESMFDDRAD